ncbi:EF-hand domain-containing protein [Sulfuriferula nivalis]|uniref:EF-hand domain-containing protein n=1 Tax=Sulfuriferula nivalis TaxID=2675298 RepID=A0A809RGF4_9PROT|nr:EF-hand domain-containing protein [Sulfuriferula nivalis]BBP00655.1 hypothetical protein SFSGTM_13630 [Sulfuriferula nivalis]
MKNVTYTAMLNKVAQTVALGFVLAIGSTAIARADAPAPAAAQDQGFGLYDTNHDGMIDRAEATAQAVSTKTFEAADTNHDGKLSQSEFDKVATTNNSAKTPSAN